MPELASVHIDAALTNVAIAYPMGEFISPRLIPDVPVSKKSDYYFIFDATREALRPQNVDWAPGTDPNKTDYPISNSTYKCRGKALMHVIPDSERANSDSPLSPDIDATEDLISKVMVDQEIAAKAALDASLTGSYTSDPTNEWDDKTLGDPFADINLAINTIEDGSGLTPNVISMDSKVFRALKEHPDIVERVVYGGGPTNPAQIGPQAIAALFGFEEVIIGSSMKNATVEPNATVTRTWGSDVYLAYRAARPSVRMVSMAYRFTWSPFAGSRFGWMVEKARHESPSAKADKIWVSKFSDQKVTCSTAGYRLQNRLT